LNISFGRCNFGIKSKVLLLLLVDKHLYIAFNSKFFPQEKINPSS
jgi:hypothetical protein